MSPSSRLVGRDTELSAIAAFLDTLDTPSTGCAGLLIAGEPGIGKSTIWAAARDAARARAGDRVTILACRCAQAEAKLSFSALGDLLGQVLDTQALRLPPPQARALEIALLRTDPPEGALDTRAVCVAVLGAIRQLCSSGSVVVAIDDIQWLEEGTAGVLDFALRRLDDQPVAVVASVRSGSGGTPALDLEQVPRFT